MRKRHFVPRIVLFWRLSLCLIGVLVGLLMPAIAPNFSCWPFDLVVLPGIGFVAGGVYGRFRDRLAVEKAGMSSELKLNLWNVGIGVLAAILLLFLTGFCLMPQIRT